MSFAILVTEYWNNFEMERRSCSLRKRCSWKVSRRTRIDIWIQPCVKYSVKLEKLRRFSGKNMRLKNNLLIDWRMSFVEANPIWFNFTLCILFTSLTFVVNLILIPFCSNSVFGSAWWGMVGRGGGPVAWFCCFHLDEFVSDKTWCVSIISSPFLSLCHFIIQYTGSSLIVLAESHIIGANSNCWKHEHNNVLTAL